MWIECMRGWNVEYLKQYYYFHAKFLEEVQYDYCECLDVFHYFYSFIDNLIVYSLPVWINIVQFQLLLVLVIYISGSIMSTIVNERAKYRKSGKFHCKNIFVVDGSYKN